MLITSQTRLFDTWRVKRSLKAIIGTRAQIQVGDTGIHIENAGNKGSAEWSEISELKVSDAIIIPMRGRLPLGWMPTDAFASTDSRDAALAFMREQIAKSRVADSSTPR